MQKVKEQIDYMYICRKLGKWNQIKALPERVAGISMLRVIVTENGKSRGLFGGKQDISESLLRKLKKIVKKYHIQQCAVGADLIMAERLQLSDTLFQARKQELMERKENILRGRFGEIAPNFSKKSFLLVLDSRNWSEQDLLQLLLTAKDYYNDLNIVTKENHINQNKITTFLYEEWGIVLHVLSEKAAMKSRMDYILFLLEKWDSKIYRYAAKQGYVVSENERGLVRSREKGKFHTGFVYECGGIELPYQTAVDIYYQNRELYDKFAITFIDIYSV